MLRAAFAQCVITSSWVRVRAEGERRELTLRYLQDVWVYDDESSLGIPTEMVVEVCRQLGISHTVRWHRLSRKSLPC